jgi:release factor glutamine methyltransferase
MPAASDTLTLRAQLAAAIETLAAAGVPTPRVDAEWLLAAVLGVGRLEAQLELDRAFPEPLAARFGAAVGRRANREPLQRILGGGAFRGLTVRLTDDVLVPRPETELLVEWALELLPAARDGLRPLAVDLGTGSGCIACALAAERTDLDVLALDVSPAAAAVARANVVALGLARRVRVVAGDLLAAVRVDVRLDLVVSNPPYLPSALVPELEPEVSRYDPRGALDGGADGLGVIRKLVAAARRALRPAGALVLETAGGRQAAAAADLLAAAGFDGVAVRADLAGVERFVAGNA